MSRQKVLITGGAGFIGTALTRRLLATHDVILLDNLRRNSLKDSELANDPRIKLVVGDVRNASDVQAAVQGVDYVVHMASIAGVDTVLREPVATMEIAIEGTINTLRASVEASKTRPVKRFIDFSTSEVFGTYAYRVNEGNVTSLGAVGEARWTYAVSKLATEHLAHNYWKQFKLPACSIRPFNIYGPGQVGEGAVHAFILRAIKGEPLRVHNDGDQIRSWCYIDDIIEAIMLTLDSDQAPGQAFNIGNARSTVTIYQLARMVVELAKSQSKIEFVEWNHADVELRIPDVRKAEKLLGFKAKIDLEEGILRTIEWYRSRLKD